jgi:hypothetical protein
VQSRVWLELLELGWGKLGIGTELSLAYRQISRLILYSSVHRLLPFQEVAHYAHTLCIMVSATVHHVYQSNIAQSGSTATGAISQSPYPGSSPAALAPRLIPELELELAHSHSHFGFGLSLRDAHAAHDPHPQDRIAYHTHAPPAQARSSRWCVERSVPYRGRKHTYNSCGKCCHQSQIGAWFDLLTRTVHSASLPLTRARPLTCRLMINRLSLAFLPP